MSCSDQKISKLCLSSAGVARAKKTCHRKPSSAPSPDKIIKDLKHFHQFLYSVVSFFELWANVHFLQLLISRKILISPEIAREQKCSQNLRLMIEVEC